MNKINWPGLKILVVEDEQDLRDVLCMIFEYKGCKVFSAADGKEGLSLVMSQSPDLVISDVRMPEMDGMEMLKKIRETHPEIPLVFLATGFAEVDRDMAKQMGASDLVQKPFRSQVLIESIEAVLKTNPHFLVKAA